MPGMVSRPQLGTVSEVGGKCGSGQWLHLPEQVLTNHPFPGLTLVWLQSAGWGHKGLTAVL